MQLYREILVMIFDELKESHKIGKATTSESETSRQKSKSQSSFDFIKII